MKVYQEDKRTIFLSQFKDPLMDHLYQKILIHLDEAPGGEILDIGCGIGKVAFWATQRGFKVTGIDREKKAIEIAQEILQKLEKKIRPQFILGNFMETMSLKGKKFDAIICSEVIEHLDEPGKFLQKAKQLLKKGGLFILTVPRSKKLWTVADEYAQHKRRFEINEVKDFFKGYKILHLYTVGFPFMIILFFTHHLWVNFFHFQSSGSWRKSKVKTSIYYPFASVLLKIDDLFNSLNLGTNIVIAVQRKK